MFKLRDENKFIAFGYKYIRSAAFFVNWSAQMLFIQIKYGNLYEVEKIIENKTNNNEQ